MNRSWIERRIPHAGRMCLLDEVLAWSDTTIKCSSTTHRDSANPLRSNGLLGIACGVEYAAQTMAVHGALRGPALDTSPSHDGTPRDARAAGGFLAGLRGLRFHVLRLDDVGFDLICNAECVAGDTRTALYDFSLWGGTHCLLEGRATVILDAAALQ